MVRVAPPERVWDWGLRMMSPAALPDVLAMVRLPPVCVKLLPVVCSPKGELFFYYYSPKVLGMWYWGPVSGIFQTVTLTGGMGSLMHPLASSMLMV